MNFEEIARQLSVNGILHEVQKGFDNLLPFVNCEARIVCASKYSDSPRKFHGISFWLYGRDELWFLGLWSGIYYQIQKPEIIIDIASELLSGKWIDSGPPAELPEHFCLKFNLRACAG